PWEVHLRQKQAQIRKALVVEALRLQASKLEADRSLGRDLETFVRTLPPVATRREILARALGEDHGRSARGKDRTR
ncbi:MAG: relaxase/mobilization nuclease domain-containing protein, partial [Brevundimonas aurantiaca]